MDLLLWVVIQKKEKAINNAASNSGKEKVAKISFAPGGAIVSIML